MQLFDFTETERNFYETETIPLVSGDNYSQYQLIKAINYTRRNKYMDDGATDNIIGDFPYDNISKYRIRLEARSTDFDIKHIEIEPVDASDEARVSAMIATKALQKKLRDIKFGKFLNTYADKRPEYGAVLVKKTTEGVHYVPWENVITDMTDILSSPIIEEHYYSPSQLKKQSWDNIDLAIQTANEKKRDKDIGKNSSDDADTIGRYIKVTEITGEFPRSVLLEAQEKEWDEKDEMEFVLCHFLFAPFGKDKDGKNQGIVLKADEMKEKDHHYKLDVRHPVVGRAFGEGIPEELAEHQRWHNFFKTEEARAVAVGGKVVYVTDDGNVVDSLFSDGVEHGTIMQKSTGTEFYQLNQMPNSVPVYQNISAAWEDSANKNTSSFDAVMGEESKAGTPFRAQYLQNIAGTSQFEREREDMGFFVIEIIEDWLLDEALAEAAKADEIDAIFSKEELNLIDKTIANKMKIAMSVQAILNKQVVTPEMQMQMDEEIPRQLAAKGARRKITEIKDFIKKAGDKVIIHTTDEQRSKQVLFESYSNALMLFSETDPARLALRDKILDQMGITPEQLAMYANEASMMAQQTPQQTGGKFSTEALKAEEAIAPVV
jgi:hypothetical protein